VIEIAITVTACLTLLCSYRVVKGPSVADRAIAIDAINTNVVALGVLYAMHTESHYFVNISLMLAITGFIATAASSRYIKKGEIIE